MSMLQSEDPTFHCPVRYFSAKRTHLHPPIINRLKDLARRRAAMDFKRIRKLHVHHFKKKVSAMHALQFVAQKTRITSVYQ